MRALGVGALVVAWAALAQAQPTAEQKTPYALAWVRDDGAESCPAGRDFADEVTRRLGRSPFDARADRAIEIRVDRDGSAYRSHVIARERDGRVAGQRTLSSPNDCAPLFSATALAVALLIDPEATLHADAGATQAVAQFEVPPRPAPSAPPPPEPASVPPPRRAPTPPPTEPAPPSRNDVGSVSARAALAIGVVPGVVPGAELFVRTRLGDGTGPGLGWSASALYLASGDASALGTTFEVGLTSFSLAALLELVDSRAFTAGLDAGVHAGALRTAVLPPPSNGTSVVATDPGDFFYLSLGAGFHAEARLTRWLVLNARAGALFPLLRRRLEVTRASTGSSAETLANTEVWLQPAVGALGALGLGVPFR